MFKSRNPAQRLWVRFFLVVMLVVLLLSIVAMVFKREIGRFYLLKTRYTRVASGLYIEFPEDMPADERKEISERARSDYSYVEKNFGAPLRFPVCIQFRSLEFFRDQGAEGRWGAYYPRALKETDLHLVALEKKGLPLGFLRHELAHAWVMELAPDLALYRNEGIAHFLEPSDGPPEQRVNIMRGEDLLNFKELPKARELFRKSKDKDLENDQKLRAVGWALTFALVVREKWSLRRVAQARDEEIPDPEELVDWTHAVLLWAAKQPAIK